MDTYRTVASESPEILFKEKNSKFFGCVFPVTTEEGIKLHLEQLRKKHPGAGHFCYAWQIGTESVSFRANDDGEPSNTAGMPIYGQIQSFNVTNVLVVVVRFFGGVKLGVGGLITAYRTAAQMALEKSEIVERTIDVEFEISFGYANINKVMRIIREKNARIVSQQMEMNCMITIAIRKKDADGILMAFEPLFEVSVKQQ